MTKNKSLPERKEVPNHLKWKTSDIYISGNEWENDFKNTKKRLKGLLKFKGTLSGKEKNLLDALGSYEELGQAVEKLFFYAHIKKDEDNTDSKYQAMLDRAQTLAVEFDSVTSFLVPEILSIPQTRLNKIKPDKKFKKYSHFLDNLIRKKKHILSEKEEKILALSGEIARAPGHIFNMINDADIKFPKIRDEQNNLVELTKGRYKKFMESKTPTVRKQAFNKLYDAYHKQRNTIASTLAYSLKKDSYYANVRGYGSTLQAALFDDNIPLSVYDNLIESVNRNLEPLHKYIGIKKKALGLKNIHTYDLYVPLTDDIDIGYEYSRAAEMVKESLYPLGTAYSSIIEQAYSGRWIDVLENRGKTSGAYSWGCYDCHPYILLNYQENLDNIFTIAHEMGHAAHSYLSNKKQPYINASYSIFIAEIASTLNEILLTGHLLKKYQDHRIQTYILNHHLEQFRNTVYRQTMFAEFEKEIHAQSQNQKPLTADNLSDIYYSLNQKYHGSNIVIDKKIEMEWARIPHFYNCFYVYKYATGFCAASALAENMLKNTGNIDKYIDFLSSGGSDYPINLLKKAGIDMTIPQPVDKALHNFSMLVDKLENLI
ncbi:MAG: oligoendopeptidase F [Actinomycetota bacterium]